jgi:hypothetical protein
MNTAALVQIAGGSLGNAAHAILAAPGDPILNTDGIVGAITRYVVPILLAILGVIFISRAGKGEMSRVLTSSAIAIIGLAFIAGAGVLFIFGAKLVTLIFG